MRSPLYKADDRWPYKFVHALLRIVMATGHLNVQAHTPARQVSPMSDDGWITVKTDRGDVRARQVIHATVGDMLDAAKNRIDGHHSFYLHTRN